MTHFLDIANVAFSVLGYPISYVELIGTASGLASVYFASKANILTWPTGVVNAVFLFILFFQVQLYPDMFLQVYFFTVNIYGWYNWNKRSAESDISTITNRNRLLLASAIVAGTVLSGVLFSYIHHLLPGYFKLPAAYPFVDSFVMVSSIVAMVLLAKKKLENWHLWIMVDVVCIILYYRKGVYFLSLEYVIFLVMASYGLYHWHKKMRA